MQTICHEKKKVVMISVGHRRKKMEVKLVKIGPLIDNIIIIIIIITMMMMMMMMIITIITIVILLLLLYYSLLISIFIAYILYINHIHILQSCKEKY